MSKVLILSYEGDEHADVVEKNVLALGTECFRVHTNKLHESYLFTFSSDSMEYEIEDLALRRKITLDPSWTIWNRRVQPPDLQVEIHPDLQDIVVNESRKSWEGLLQSHEGKVVSRPIAIAYGSNKLHQLKFVREHSSEVKVPDTMVTNDPIAARAFYEQYSGNVCFKLHHGAVVRKEGENHFIYTNKLEPRHLEKMDLIRMNPSLFQEYVDKEYELRITVVGEEVIPIAIHSQDSEISRVDFRRYDFDKVKYEFKTVPKEVEELCRTMLKHYGLNYGAFDFIYDRQGEYTFLELNPNGQWLWLEQLSGHDIGGGIASYLAR